MRRRPQKQPARDQPRLELLDIRIAPTGGIMTKLAVADVSMLDVRPSAETTSLSSVRGSSESSASPGHAGPPCESGYR
jgi:hypothetical protein